MSTSVKTSPDDIEEILDEEILDEEIWDTKKVSHTTSLSRTKIWQLEKKNKFPKRRQITERRVGWLKSEILAWMKNLAVAV